MPDPRPRFRRTQAARDRRPRPDRLSSYIIGFSIALGVVLVFGIAYLMTNFV